MDFNLSPRGNLSDFEPRVRVMKKLIMYPNKCSDGMDLVHICSASMNMSQFESSNYMKNVSPTFKVYKSSRVF